LEKACFAGISRGSQPMFAQQEPSAAPVSLFWRFLTVLAVGLFAALGDF